MRRFIAFAGLFFGAFAQAQSPPQVEAPPAVRAVVTEHCLKCHAGAKAKAKVDLETLLGQPISAKTLPRWVEALEVVKAGEMPPTGQPPLPVESRDAFLAWIEGRMAEAVKANAGDSGPVVVRRLTRGDLDRTLLALTSVPIRASALLPADGAGGEGFANVGSVQPISPEVAESHLEVARFVADRLIVTSGPPIFGLDSCTEGDFAASKAIYKLSIVRRLDWALDMTTRLLDGASRVRHGEKAESVATVVQLPAEQIQLAAKFFAEPIPPEFLHPKIKTTWGPVFGCVRGEFAALPAPGKIASAEYQSRLRALADVVMRYQAPSPLVKQPLPVQAFVTGLQPEIGVPQSLVNLSFDKKIGVTGSGVALKNFKPTLAAKVFTANQKAELERFVATAQEVVALDGHKKAAGKALDVRKKIDACAPEHRIWLLDFAAKAWRRPLTEADREALSKFYEAARTRLKDHPMALRETVARVLASPEFWYRTEQPIAGKARHPVSGRELAVRLSYFLWAGPPDETLRAAGADGSLLTEKGLNDQTRRMLADPRASGLVDEFFLAWLGLIRFADDRNPNPERFPAYKEQLVQSMDAELRAFLADIVRNDRSIDDLACATWTYLDERLAKHYGVPGVSGPLLRKVDVTEHGRGGLLAQGAFLVSSSYSLRTSPVKRGSFILQELLGKKLPPPPPDAGQLPEDDRLPDKLTVRQRLDAHRRDPACASCHRHVDPPGFALEGFDVIGRRRTHYEGPKGKVGLKVDDIGESASGQKVQGLAGLRVWLQQERGRLHRQFAVKLTGYALGRAVELTDRPLIDAMTKVAAQNDGRIGPMIETLVLSEQFRSRRGSVVKPGERRASAP